jgi:hypothetical protein
MYTLYISFGLYQYISLGSALEGEKLKQNPYYLSVTTGVTFMCTLQRGEVQWQTYASSLCLFAEGGTLKLT